MATPVTVRRTSSPLGHYLRHSRSPLQAAALTLPLLVVYGIGVVLFPAAGNGVDFITQGLFHLIGLLGEHRTAGYFGFYGLLVVANLVILRQLRDRGEYHPRWFFTLLAESAVYAFVIGNLSSAATSKVTGVWAAIGAVPLAAVREHGLVDGLVVSAGAGLHEELVFRLVGIGAVARMWLGRNWLQPSAQLAGLLVATSMLFSAVHHLVEPFALDAFVFRSVAGLLFGLLFLLRGFAVAAWTHALYDVWVIVVLGR
jgi:uncharacterized MnhB-related membrane protein